MPTLIHQWVAAAQAGQNPRVITRLSSGWLVLGEAQFVRGYSLLLPDPVVPHLNAMPLEVRTQFLREMSLAGDAILEVTGAGRINYEMLGNVEPALHAHLFPRYETEPEEFRTKPVWFYDWMSGPQFDADEHGQLMREIADAVQRRL